jgi:hypothetical protein
LKANVIGEVKEKMKMVLRWENPRKKRKKNNSRIDYSKRKKNYVSFMLKMERVASIETLKEKTYFLRIRKQYEWKIVNIFM